MKTFEKELTVKDIISVLHTSTKIHIFDYDSLTEVVNTEVFDWLETLVYANTIVDYVVPRQSELFIYAHVA